MGLFFHLQCIVNAGSGACPDTISNPSGVNDVTLVTSSFENGITTIVYRRPLVTGDPNTDKDIRIDQPMYIAWGIGPINPTGTAAKHRQRTIGKIFSLIHKIFCKPWYLIILKRK